MKIKYLVSLLDEGKEVKRLEGETSVPKKTGTENTGFVSLYFHGVRKNTSPYKLFAFMNLLTDKADDVKAPEVVAEIKDMPENLKESFLSVFMNLLTDKADDVKAPEVVAEIKDMPENLKESSLSVFKVPSVAPVIVDANNKPLVSLQAINKVKK